MNVTFIEMGVTHANTCNSFLISLKEMLLSLSSLHITLMLLYWAILLHHSLSLFSRHFPSFIILTRGFLFFPLINPCLHCWTILVYALGFFLSHGNIVSHLTYLDCFRSLLYFIVSYKRRRKSFRRSNFPCWPSNIHWCVWYFLFLFRKLLF